MARSLENRLKSDLNAIRYCLRTSDFWLMRPCLRTPGGGRRAETARSRPPDALRAFLLPLSSPRGVERNNKDTTNGARTLTAANLSGCWEKPETLWLSCPSSGGVLSGKFANNALQHAREFVYNFFDFTGLAGGEVFWEGF